MNPAEHRAHLAGLEAHLRSRLLGQDHLLARATAAFQRGELGLASPGRPRGSCLVIAQRGSCYWLRRNHIDP